MATARGNRNMSGSANLLTVASAGTGAVLPLGVRMFADVKANGERRELVSQLGAASTPSVLTGGLTGLAGLGIWGANILGYGRGMISDSMARDAGAYGVPALAEAALFALRPAGSPPGSQSAQAGGSTESSGINIEVSGRQGNQGSSGTQSAPEQTSTPSRSRRSAAR